MSMPKNQAKEPIVYVRRRKKKENVEVGASVVAWPAQQDISSKEIDEMSSKTLSLEPTKLLENKEAKTIEKGRTTKHCYNSSTVDSRQSKDGGAGNDKIISDNREENRKTWRPLDESKKVSLLVLPTHEEINENQLALVHDRNIDYAGRQLDFSGDFGETTHILAHTKVWESNTFDADQKGKMIYQENNNNINSADFCAQRGNRGITICEKIRESRSEEMAKFLETSNDHSGGQNLQLQNMNQVTPNYLLCNGMKEMSVRPNHTGRITVHPSRIIDSSTFSPKYDQNMQRTSMSVPHNFSLMKLLMENENSSTLTDEELLHAKDLLSTDQGLSLEGKGMQQSTCSRVENHQNMQRTSESATTNFSSMKLLMEDAENSKLTNELYEKQFLNTQYSLPSQMVQQWPYGQVGNSQNMQRTPESATSNFSYMKLLMEDEESSTLTCDLYEKQLLGTQYSLSSEEQTVQQLPVSQVENYQFGNSSPVQMVQQLPCVQVGNSPFDNSVQQNCQNQVLPQSQEISFRELLAGDGISYMDLLTREDLLISWTCDD